MFFPDLRRYHAHRVQHQITHGLNRAGRAHEFGGAGDALPRHAADLLDHDFRAIAARYQLAQQNTERAGQYAVILVWDVATRHERAVVVDGRISAGDQAWVNSDIDHAIGPPSIRHADAATAGTWPFPRAVSCSTRAATPSAKIPTGDSVGHSTLSRLPLFASFSVLQNRPICKARRHPLL